VELPEIPTLYEWKEAQAQVSDWRYGYRAQANMEVTANPVAGDYIEILNTGTAAIDVAFSGGAEFKFAGSPVAEPADLNGTVVINLDAGARLLAVCASEGTVYAQRIKEPNTPPAANTLVIQKGVETNAADWQAVTFPQAFTEIPVVNATPIWVDFSTSRSFFVLIKDVSKTSFQYKTMNYDGTDHTSPRDQVSWIAIGE
jgi:hypothetical protein